jgi:DNA-binding transcriptional LysR family regulator
MLDLTLRDLEYVVALEAERNFSRAAEQLHMAQPALSQAVMRIERRLGVVLFARTSRHVTPTEAGAQLCTEASEILAHVERTLQRTRQIGVQSQAVHVHVSEPSLQTPRRLLSAVRARHSDLAVHQTTLPHSQVVDELRRGSLNLAIGRRISGDEIASELVRREGVGVLMTQGHPLASGDAVKLVELADYPLVAIDDRLSAWNVWVEKLLAEESLVPTWSPSTTFGAAPGSDLVSDGHTLMVCVESIGTESVDPYTWRPLDPPRDVGWYLSWHDTPPPVEQAMAAIREFVQSTGWAARAP